MTEFENIFEQANKNNGKGAPPPKTEPKPAPEAGEKKSFAEVQREKSEMLRDDRRSVRKYRGE